MTTPANARRLAVAGAVHLRTRDDARALRAALLERPRLLVVGGGWIETTVGAA